MRLISLFIFLLNFMMFAACNNAAQKQSEFYYYPARNVYYDVANSLYFYSLDGGKTWDSLYVKTNSEPSTLGNKQIIYSNVSEIWKNNEAHINQYGGKLFSLNDGDSTNSQSSLAADRKIKKAKPKVVVPDKKPEKKPGFFQRLFGKKNKT